jgi:molybdate transport system permease protein
MPAVAGPRVHWLAVVTSAFVAVFVLTVVVLVVVDLLYTSPSALWDVLWSDAVRHAIRLSLITSTISLVLVMVFAVPMGYALSRYRFPGSVVIDAIVDLPIVLPPVVLGVSLLVLFRTSLGQWIESLPGLQFVYSPQGIVLCQFLTSASYAIRMAKATFDAVDRRLEHVAMTLGCGHGRAFWMVALPMSRNGLAAGAVMAWARALGIFGPLMVFVGTVRMKTEVMPTTVYLELSVGRIEPALAVSLLMLAVAMAAMVAIHALGQSHRWWTT